MGRVLVAELQRLKRRARSRLFTVLTLAALITGALLFRIATKPVLAHARVVIAVIEGDMAMGRTPTPMHELRDYVGSVLLDNAKLLPIIDEHPKLFPLRKKLGDAYALGELRDMYELSIWRNYFLYGYSADERRTARIEISVNHVDPDFAVELVHRITQIIIDGEAAHRHKTAEQLRATADDAIDVARKRVKEAEDAVAARQVETARAKMAGQEGRASVLRDEVAALDADARRAREVLDTVVHTVSSDQLDAAITQAGLGLELEVADERKPEIDEEARNVKIIVIAAILFVLFVPIVAIGIGSFDSRIHDLEDVSRLGLPLVGHVPGFSGDRVGSLRDRGIRRRRVPSY